jgi:hypothetical protein
MYINCNLYIAHWHKNVFQEKRGTSHIRRFYYYYYYYHFILQMLFQIEKKKKRSARVYTESGGTDRVYLF